MATAVQSVTQNPYKLFETSQEELGAELQDSPRSVIKNFIKAVSNKEWLECLTQEQKKQCALALKSVLPEHSRKACLDVFLTIFQELDVSEEDDDFGVQMLRDNRQEALESVRLHFLQEFPTVEPCDDLLLLYLIQQEYRESGASKYLKLILKEGIDYEVSINGRDLLFVVASEGTSEDLQLTLDFYKMKMSGDYRSFLSGKMERLIRMNLDCPDKMRALMQACLGARLEPKKWLQDIDWIHKHECFEVVKNQLDSSSVHEFYQAYGLHHLLPGAMVDEKTWLNTLNLLRTARVEPKDFFPQRKGNALTAMEKALLMIGKREACERVVKLVGNNPGMKITISKSDRIYHDFEPNRSRDHLEKLYLQIEEKIQLPVSSTGDIDITKYRDIWESEELIDLVDQFLSAAILETFYILKDSYEKSGQNPLEMNALLHDKSEKGPQYIHRFFSQSFVVVYHLARNMSTLVPGYRYNPVITRKDEEPFFSPGTPQFCWRQMYNSLQITLEMFGLTEMHKNYINWTEPDLCYKVPELSSFQKSMLEDMPNAKLIWANPSLLNE